jgi:preprotein translocase subunit SecG
MAPPIDISNSVLNVSTAEIETLISEVSKVNTWLETIGILAILWLIFALISWYYNRKNSKRLEKIEQDLRKIKAQLTKRKK